MSFKCFMSFVVTSRSKKWVAKSELFIMGIIRPQSLHYFIQVVPSFLHHSYSQGDDNKSYSAKIINHTVQILIMHTFIHSKA